MKKLLVALALLLAQQHTAFAWNEEGHSIVAELAQRRLTPEALAQVKKILGGEISLASIASWPDDIRDQRPDTYNWHFVSIPLAEQTYDEARYCQERQGRGDCLIKAVDRLRAILRDPQAPMAAKKDALKFLVHFVGDIHQPLHTVFENLGENLLTVSFFIDPRNKNREVTNLHAVWDTNLIRNQFWAWGTYADWLETNWFPTHDLNALSAGTTVDWMLDAHKVAADAATPGIEMNAELDQAYATRMRPFLDTQLALGGLRLARVLNETLK